MGKGSITKVHHIGVTVNDAPKTLAAWEAMFEVKGKVVDIREDFRIGVLTVAGVTFFFNEIRDSERRAKAVESLNVPIMFGGHQIVTEHGEGISHIAFETTDLDYHLDRARSAGLRVERETHKDSLEGMCNFIDPDDVSLPLEFMMPVEGRKNPLE